MTAEPIDCTEAVRRLWEYLDDGSARPGHDALEEHLTWCLRCCGELEFARELRRLLRVTGRVEMPADVRERLEVVIDGLDGPTITEVER